MTSEIQELQEKIKHLKHQKEVPTSSHGTQGYGIAMVILTDLMSCILVGLSMGLFLQKVFHTSGLLTAGLTLFGGIAGLYTVIRYAIKKDKK
ncbi:MAG: AtpZ/AtpI family protein [Alphaproteobacteria bacterium]